MRRSFAPGIRDWVTVERYKGKKWKDIKREVGNKFGVEPPSIRVMQRWFQTYEERTDQPSGVNLMVQNMEDIIDRATPIVYARMLRSIRDSSRYQRLRQLPTEDAAWMLCLALIEAEVGHSKFDRLVSDYQRLRPKENAMAGVKGGRR